MSDSNDDRQMDALLERARGLPESLEPERDLWPSIRASMSADLEAQPFWAQKRVAIAAAVLICASTGLGFWLGRALTPPVEFAAMPDEAPLFGPHYTLGAEFVDARMDLSRSLARELERMPPETRRIIAANLATLEEALEQINRALSDDPNNVMLQQLLLSAYTEELTFLREVNGLSRNVRVRTEI